MRAIVTFVGAVLIATPVAAQSQVNCSSYYVGAILYTSCNGQPGAPAVQGVDTSIYRQPPQQQTVNPFDVALKMQELRNLQEQNRALHASTPPPVTPAPAATPASAPKAAPNLDELVPSGTYDGKWWIQTTRLANSGNDAAFLMRLAVVRAMMDGLDIVNIIPSTSFDDYTARRAKMFRSDLTFEQILAKLDGYYAEPDNGDVTLSIAILSVMRPLTK